MATDMNIVEVILREIVKPSSPTPHHFKTHELCFIDHSVPLMYFPLLLFYSHDNSIHDSRSVGGKDQPSNDKDLEKPDIQLLRQFLAAEPESQGARISPLLLVQATFFECGGMAIGLSVLHNAMDAASLTTSLNSYIYSGKVKSKEVCVRNFKPTKIAALQCKAASESVKNPTRVEAVCALLWKSAMEASESNKGSLKPSVFCQVINLHPRTAPPLPENLVGNLIGKFPAKLE
ncbi:hypothetical protein FEM48_Zijuj07G0065800 [Ziziphus jujuba var. spinosa]|uniref:BAHD acyltransferase At5g47980-like n=1 Tax=Ziziphus jujuba var. spinosa TaxID=714518 RepID=A0A978V319_ZIZJJ|nr:hypothetical protein FEM48_Zijuj07G0065800 [Ziziphus jujuba var. spinosa]